MSFSIGQITGFPGEVEESFSSTLGHEREQRVLGIVNQAVKDIVNELGDYVAVSVNGHVNEYAGQVGDSLNIQVSSLLPPSLPAQDAGLEAAGGSARNFPPEASTAAPATEDASPPAAQEPNPQPAEVAPPVPPVADAGQVDVRHAFLDPPAAPVLEVPAPTQTDQPQ